MNGFVNLKIFATALVVTVLVGPVVQWLMPTWAALVADVGPGGAWFASILYHIVYGIIIGAGAALAVAVLGRIGRSITQQAAVIAACLTVILFDVGFVVSGVKVSEFSYLAILLALISFVLQIAVVLLLFGKKQSSSEA
ncbi:MAG: hypothetical protein OQL27_02215 [Sedimenticola sp.]|nr:hypothetical protein [Sedimenticola sp.]